MTSDTPSAAHARFDCAACGGVAGIVRLVPSRHCRRHGLPMGEQEHQADGFTMDHWLGTSWQKVSPATYAIIAEVLTREQSDVGQLRTIHWKLTPFWCWACQRSYCRDHWERIVIMDEGFYDYKDGICPRRPPLSDRRLNLDGCRLRTMTFRAEPASAMSTEAGTSAGSLSADVRCGHCTFGTRCSQNHRKDANPHVQRRLERAQIDLSLERFLLALSSSPPVGW